MIEANKKPWLTLFWHHLYSRLSLHVLLVSLYCCLNGLCLRCDWQRSEKFNLTNLSHCCGCCNCESRLPCKDRHGQMRAPQTCTDCPRPFATRKKIHPHLAHTPSFRWPDAALLSVLEFLASFYEHPKTSQPNEVSFPTDFQKMRLPGLQIWRWLFQGPQSWLAAECCFVLPNHMDGIKCNM